LESWPEDSGPQSRGRKPHGKRCSRTNAQHQQKGRGDYAQIFTVLCASACHNWECGIDDGCGENEYDAADKPDGGVKASLSRWENVLHHDEIAIVDDHLAGIEE